MARIDTCTICHQRGNFEGHHVLPVEYGGPEDGKVVPLCPTCHTSIHKEAEDLSNGKDPPPGYSSHLADTESRQRYSIFVNYIVSAKQLHISSGKTKADTARNIVGVSLSNDELRALHAIKQALGFTSITNTIRALIQEKYIDLRSRRRR